MILAAGSPFDPVYNFFGAILAFFYSIIPNLGVAIILLTILVMLVMFPLTAKQAKSMMAMQRAQPEIKKLQAKYKNDRAKLNEEMMEFYKENKINPLAGCLPLLVQMPIFLALFRVMREPYKHVPKSSDLYAAFCTGRTGHLHIERVQPAEAYGPLPNPQYFLGMDLSQHATAVTGGFLDALPYFILVGLVIVTGFAAGAPEPAQRAEHELADGDHHVDPADRLRSLLAAVPRRSGPLLPGEQPLAPGPAGAHHAQDHPTRAGRHRFVRDQGRRDRRGGHRYRHVRVPARRGRAAQAVPDARRQQRRRRRGAPNGANGANGAPKPTADRPAGEAIRRRGKNATKGRRPRGVGQGRDEGHRGQGSDRVECRRVGGQRLERELAPSEQQEAQTTLTARSRRSNPTRRRRARAAGEPKRAITMEWVETTGRTIAEALDAALDELGVDEDDVEYEVLEQPKSGFLGRLGSSEGRIRARVKPISREKPGERQRRRERPGPEHPAPRRERQRGQRPRPRRCAERTGRRRAQRRPVGRRLVQPPAAREPIAAATAPNAVVRVDRLPAAAPAAGAHDQQQGSTVDTIERDVPIEEQAAAAEKFTQGLVDTFDLGARAKSVIDEDVVVVEVTGDNLGLLVGPKGATLHAIEELVRTVVQRQTDGHGVRIHVDVAGYRAKRRAASAEFTRALAEKVLETGKPQALEPMSASDRKVVHDTAAEIDGIATESEGEDPRRRVVLRPA